MQHKLFRILTSLVISLAFALTGFSPALAAAPANDNFANAQIIQSLPFSGTVDITDATMEPNEPIVCGTIDRTAWYAFTPTQTMLARVTSGGTVSFSSISIFTATGPSLSDLQLVWCPLSNPAPLTLQAGQTYYFQAGAYPFELGTIDLNVVEVFPPANDNFSGAESIAALPFSKTIDIGDAWNEPGEIGYCGSMEKTVWYSFSPSEKMLLSSDTLGSSIYSNAAIYLQTGTGVSDLNFLGCTSNGSFSFPAEAGQTYYLQLGASYSSFGMANIELRHIIPPDNDNFENSQTVSTIPFNTFVDISDATTQPQEQQWCSYMDRTVWYSFNPTEKMLIHVDTEGSAIAANINVYHATGSGISDMQVLLCTSLHPTSNFLAEAGQTYYLQVGSTDHELGTVNVNLVEIPRPANDDIAQAEPIGSLPFKATPDVTNATNETNEPQNCSSMPNTVWYSFTPSETMFVRADTQGSAVSGNVNVYGTNNLNFLGCSTYNNPVIFRAEAGQTYYLQAGGINGEAGIVHVNLEQIPPPPNNDFANASSINSLPSTVDFDTTAGTFENNEPSPSCAFPAPPYRTIWFAFTASQDGSVSASIPNANYSPFVAVYSGSGFNNLTQLGCGIYSNPITFHAVHGQTYYIQVGGVYGEGGTGQLFLQTTPPPRAAFYNFPVDPSKFDTIQFYDSSYDPGQVGFQSFTWNFGDGATATGYSVPHKYAADGNYQVTHTVTTIDGRTATITQTVQVRTHDVAITKITTPASANVGQTKTITVTLRNVAYPETVQIDLYKSTPNGFVWIATVTKSVPALSGNRTTAVNFSYTFTSDDAKLGKVTFKAVATISGARDAYPSDNEAISSITKVAK